MTQLDNLIKNLNKANKRLKEAVKANPTSMNKDATIQRFEFTFELAWKTLQAYIRDQGFDCKSPKNCIREGARLEVIKEPEEWFSYLNSRNLITHTYNEKMADEIYGQALEFPQEVDSLLKKVS
jgi:nucleotidyltransferase substrate binding protein (TIGR01987 family)